MHKPHALVFLQRVRKGLKRCELGCRRLQKSEQKSRRAEEQKSRRAEEQKSSGGPDTRVIQMVSKR